jgi:predicted XRE-type DNA-binding protein
MNPYKVDIEKLKESKEITNEKELLKLKLVTIFLKVTKDMSSEEIISATGLDKSDLSRLRALNIDRFTIDRIISFLDALGFSTNIDVKPKRAS